MNSFFKKVVLAILFFCYTSIAFAEPSIDVSGDMRYRYEAIEVGDGDPGDTQRIRGRLATGIKVNEVTSVKFQIATGRTKPTSTNQNLGDGWSSKPIWVDMAYMSLNPIKGIKLNLGKMRTPFIVPGSSELLWDADLRPEGISLHGRHKIDSVTFFGSSAMLNIREIDEEDDQSMLGFQGGIKFNLGTSSKLRIGGGYYDYQNIQGTPFFNGSQYGNSAENNSFYEHDFNELEGFIDLSFKIKSFPILIFGNSVINLETYEDNTGLVGGTILGKRIHSKPHSWDLRLRYSDVESDSVVGTFTDSDFIGGGASGRGYEVRLSFVILKNVTADITLLDTEIVGENENLSYNRLMIDLMTRI